MNPLRIAIADDHHLVRDGIVKLLHSLNYEVQRECENGEEIVNYCMEHPTDIVLMDINMPVMDGIAATSALRESAPHTKVIALSMLDDDLSLIRMMRAGAKSFIPKEAPAAELKKAIDQVAEKGYYYSEFVSERLISSISAPPENNIEKVLESLSDREIDFLKLACSGLTYKEIADKMCVSPRSIDGYRDSLFEKLEVRSRVELAIFAIKHHLVKI
jgi:DNA-binding NarL/FixJ family response regulator